MSRATIEDVRAYWNRRPCNIRHSRREVGTKEYFDEVEARKYFVEPHIPAFAQFDRWSGKKVLEIGCGIGTDSVNFARHGARLSAIDVSEESVKICRQRLEVFNLEADVRQGDAEQLPEVVEPEPFDLIYSFGVIHHTPHPELVIEHLHSYCHPATELRVMLYSKWCWKTVWIVLKYGKGAFWRADELVRKYSEAQTGCPVTFTYSRREILELFKDFHVLDVRKDHIFPFVIDRYINYEYVKVWYLRWMPQQLFRWFERRLGWHTLIVAKPKSLTS